MNKLKSIFRRFMGNLYIICDSSDNSVSLSDELLAYIREDLGPVGKVNARIMSGHKKNKPTGEYYIFFFGDEGDDNYKSTLCRNDYYDSVGFETLIPTINRIFLDYSINDKVAKLKVKPIRIRDKRLYKISKRPL